MSIPLVVNNSTFDYPTNGDPKGWGEDATEWAAEVTELLGDLKGPNDIIQTAFSVANNISSPANIIGLAFDAATVRSARIDYAIYRVTDSNELAETGQIFLVFKNNANTWSLGRDSYGDDGGVTITITTAGQLQYTSSNVTGTNYSGILRFRATSLNQ